MIPRIRSALFLPASNPRAIAKARDLPCDLVILDLEDAVKGGDKAAARAAAVAAVRHGFGDRLVAVRVNASGAAGHDEDLAALDGLEGLDYVVVPKVERAGDVAAIAARLSRPLLAMIETPAGLLAAPAIAATVGVAGLIAGTNDIAHALHLPDDRERSGLLLALQTILLAARAAGILAIDGVCNRLDDEEALAAECRQGHAFGFDGKALIHPRQIDIANRSFAASAEELEDARALVAAATGGAERFRGRMIEAMHVAAAHRLLGEADG